MEIVGRLTGGVAHDFNNILTVISGTIDILAEAVADRPDLAAIAALITEAAARGSSLTSNLIALSRSQPSQPREVDVNSLLADAARLLRPALGDRIEINAKPFAGAPRVLADPGQLMMAVLGFAFQARDAMPQGGTLSFEVAGAGREAGAGDRVMIVVDACGHGAVVGHPDAVFADLGPVEDFVRQSGGALEVGSETGHGTSARIYLPRTTGVLRSPVEAKAPATGCAPLAAPARR